MSRRRRQFKAHIATELNEGIELVIGQMTWCNDETIVNVPTGFDVATVAVSCACAVEARVLDTGLGIDSSAEDPHNRPHNALGAESRCPIPKGHGGVKVGQLPPPDREEDRLRGIQLEPTVPAAEVQLEHEQPLARIQLPALFNELDNGFCGRKEQFPDVTAVSMGGNKGINAIAHLGAVSDGPSDRYLWNRAQWTVENGKRELTRFEWPDESTVL